MALIFLLEPSSEQQVEISRYLKMEGHEVTVFKKPDDARKALLSEAPDLLISEVETGEISGYTLIKDLRKVTDLPVIFLTTRASESDKVTAFRLGADDYITKPFSHRELTLRVAALLRRVKIKLKTPALETEKKWRLSGGDVLRINVTKHLGVINDRRISLTPFQWRLLDYLSGTPDTVFSREQILMRCLDYSFTGSDRTVDTHIKNLRNKLGSSAWIETVRGYGYRFTGQPFEA